MRHWRDLPPSALGRATAHNVDRLPGRGRIRLSVQGRWRNQRRDRRENRRASAPRCPRRGGRVVWLNRNSGERRHQARGDTRVEPACEWRNPPCDSGAPLGGGAVHLRWKAPPI